MTKEHGSTNGFKPMAQVMEKSPQTGLSGLTENTDGMTKPLAISQSDSGDISQALTQRSPEKKTGKELSRPGVTGTLARPKPLFAPALGPVAVKEKATQVQLLIAQNRPSVSLRLELGPPVTICRISETKILTEKQRDWLCNHMAPCGHSVALEHLDWLAAHKRMENDVARMTVLKRDYSDILAFVPEYALALAVVWFIENHKGEWWPVLDALKDKVEEFMAPVSEVVKETNGFALGKERFGEAVARSWFAHTLIHERTLYGSKLFVCEWIKTHYLAALAEDIDEVVCVNERKNGEKNDPKTD